MDWNLELLIPDHYSTFLDKFWRMLKQFESLCNGHFGSIRAVQHQIQVEKRESGPIPFALQRTSSKTREFENQENDRMLAMDGIEPTQA